MCEVVLNEFCLESRSHESKYANEYATLSINVNMFSVLLYKLWVKSQSFSVVIKIQFEFIY